MGTKNGVRAEQPRYDTTYFPENIVRDGVCGCCHDFAVALHRKTKWPIAALWSVPLTGPKAMFHDPMPVHVFCVAPDGRCVDIEGAHAREELIERYTLQADRPRRYELHGDEDAWAAACQRSRDEMVQNMAPQSHRIKAATHVIAGSPEFLALVQTLKAIEA
jgi:hypothetical protein